MLLSTILLHTTISSTTLTLSHLLNLPTLLLQNLHTHIHPSSLPNPHRPSPPSNDPHLLRLPLTPSLPFFSLYHSSFLSSLLSLSNLSLSFLSPSSSAAAAVPFAITLISSSHLLILSLRAAAAAPSYPRLSLLSSLISLLSAQTILTHLSPSFFDFRIPNSVSPIASCLAAVLGGVLLTPAARAARAFWLGTNQSRWGLEMASCGAFERLVLYFSVMLSFFSPLLWVRCGSLEGWRVWALAAGAALQLVALRGNVQMYLNEAVLCWYRRLNSGGVADGDYGRKKVVLHNHCVCVAVFQFFAPPVIVLMLVGLSQMRGDLFGEFGVMEWSDVVKEVALFVAWWIMFVRSILMMLWIGVYRCGFAFVS